VGSVSGGSNDQGYGIGGPALERDPSAATGSSGVCDAMPIAAARHCSSAGEIG